MRLAAIVLAAGRSRRFGIDNKLLASLNGVPVIARTVAAVRAYPFNDVIVVTGPDHDAIEVALSQQVVRFVRCDDERVGMGFSIAAGVGALAPDIAGAAIVPGDMPLLRSQSIHALMEEFVGLGGDHIVHAVDQTGEQRNPVVWPRAHFAALAALEGDRGAKALISNAVRVPVSCESELLDVDDEEALRFAQSAIGDRSGSSDQGTASIPKLHGKTEYRA